jgi:hypothetical protein
MDSKGWAYVGDRLPGPQSDADTVLNVPGYRQTQSYSCAFVAGLMVLHTFKPKASIDMFWQKVRPREIDGVTNTRLIQALRQSGLGVRVVKKLTYATFACAIEQGFPAITLVKTRERDTAHWVVVYGVGENPKRIFVAGNGIPFLSKKVVPWSRFRHMLAAEKFGLLCWGK